MQALNRRAFLIGASCSVYLASTLSEKLLAAERKLFTAIGITATIDRAPEMKAAGADYIVESVSDFLIPDQSDAAFERNRAIAAEAVLPFSAAIVSFAIPVCGALVPTPIMREFSSLPRRRSGVSLRLAANTSYSEAIPRGTFLTVGRTTKRSCNSSSSFDGWHH